MNVKMLHKFQIQESNVKPTRSLLCFELGDTNIDQLCFMSRMVAKNAMSYYCPLFLLGFANTATSYDQLVEFLHHGNTPIRQIGK